MLIGIGNPPGTMDMKAFLLQKFSSVERGQVYHFSCLRPPFFQVQNLHLSNQNLECSVLLFLAHFFSQIGNLNSRTLPPLPPPPNVPNQLLYSWGLSLAHLLFQGFSIFKKIEKGIEKTVVGDWGSGIPFVGPVSTVQYVIFLNFVERQFKVNNSTLSLQITQLNHLHRIERVLSLCRFSLDEGILKQECSRSI